jgi:hypothetical protein
VSVNSVSFFSKLSLFLALCNSIQILESICKVSQNPTGMLIGTAFNLQIIWKNAYLQHWVFYLNIGYFSMYLHFHPFFFAMCYVFLGRRLICLSLNDLFSELDFITVYFSYIQLQLIFDIQWPSNFSFKSDILAVVTSGFSTWAITYLMGNDMSVSSKSLSFCYFILISLHCLRCLGHLSPHSLF